MAIKYKHQNKYLNIRIEADLFKRLKEFATAKKVEYSKVVRKAIEDYLKGK